MCIRTYEDLTLCRIKDINPKKDSEFYHELVTGGTLNPKRVGMFSMNDISCWNGTCHPNGFDIPLHRDVYHWSSQVVQMPLLWKIFSQRLAANAPFSFLKK
ncbi:hypothetical protein Pelo_19740 [Pelomyxa schiedti]|nr:hypothetical protein Pelo_19740 [Pelomyxa schiedti]